MVQLDGISNMDIRIVDHRSIICTFHAQQDILACFQLFQVDGSLYRLHRVQNKIICAVYVHKRISVLVFIVVCKCGVVGRKVFFQKAGGIEPAAVVKVFILPDGLDKALRQIAFALFKLVLEIVRSGNHKVNIQKFLDILVNIKSTGQGKYRIEQNNA